MGGTVPPPAPSPNAPGSPDMGGSASYVLYDPSLSLSGGFTPCRHISNYLFRLVMMITW